MADQANFPDIYIDGSSAGDGSLASPYSDFSDINWTTGGDNSIFDYLAGSPAASPTIHLAKAATWRETMTVGASGTATYPIIIQAYGSGADPIIKGSDLITPGTSWTEDSGGWLSGWNYRKKITVQNANIDGDLTWFPLYVPISGDTDIGGNVSDSTNGYDIRFTEDDGTTLLKYEREFFEVDGGACNANYWVSADGWVLANASATDFYIYYNDGDGSVDGESAADVWDANFEAVWHLEALTDSSGNGNTLTAQAGPATDSGGKIRGCYLFDDASSQYLDIASAIVTNEPITFEAWFKSDTTAADQTLVSVADVGSDTRWFDLYAAGVEVGDPIRTRKRNDGGIVLATSSSGFAANTWYYATGTFTSDVLRSSYIGGANKGIEETDHADPTGLDNTCIGRIGDNSPSNYMSGYIDEVRISSAARSDAWIKFTHANINEGDNELDAFGTEEEASVNIWYATVTTTPRRAVYMDGDWGDYKTAKEDLVNEYDFYWDDGEDRLYVYSSTDPDTAYTSPGVEHGVRSYVININNKDYITFDSLAPTHGIYDSIRNDTACDHITIQNLTLTHSGQSGTNIVGATNIHIDNVIAIYCRNNGIKVDTATSGTIENCDSHHNGVAGTVDAHALSLEDSSGLTIQDNKFHDSFTATGGSGIGGDDYNTCTIQYNEIYGQLPYSGIDLTGHAAGDCYSNIIRYNSFHDISGRDMAAGVFLWTENAEGADTRNNEIYYNIFYGNNNGITMDERSHDNLIYNNIIYNDGAGFRRGIYIYTSNITPVDNLIKNNIVYSTAGGIHAGTNNTEATNIFDHNCYYPDQTGCFRWNDGALDTFAAWQSASSQDASSINSDPLFIDAANDDFRLLMASPCVDAGTDVSLTTDYQGRSIRHAPDIGAYEEQTNALL